METIQGFDPISLEHPVPIETPEPLAGMDKLLAAVERLSCTRCLAETIHPLGRMLRPCEVCGGVEWVNTTLRDALDIKAGQISSIRPLTNWGPWDDPPKAA